jgi:hypothetical protein
MCIPIQSTIDLGLALRYARETIAKNGSMGVCLATTPLSQTGS